jgi:acetyl esterase/lipase
MTVRTAAIPLRGAAGLIWARIYWPAAIRPPPLLVLFGDASDALCRQVCLRGGVVVLAATATTSYAEALADAKAAVGWAADHAAELDADPARLQVAGTGAGAALAADVARQAADEGWPELTLLSLPIASGSPPG